MPRLIRTPKPQVIRYISEPNSLGQPFQADAASVNSTPRIFRNVKGRGQPNERWEIKGYLNSKFASRYPVPDSWK